MTNLTYRILGYNLDFGVVRIESESADSRDVVIFASQSIEGQLRLNTEDVIFVSKTGETARLNLASGEITQRAKPFRHHGYHYKLFLSNDARHLISVSDRSISTVDLETLTPLRTFNAVLKDESGVLRLKNYEDIKAPFEQKAAEGHQRRLASQKENPEGPWFVNEWSWARELRFWPVNVGDAFRPGFSARDTALRANGVLVAPLTTRNRPGTSSGEVAGGLGLVRIDLKSEILTFERLGGIDTKAPKRASFVALSDDGRGLLLDRNKILRRSGEPIKPKRLFGLGKRKGTCEFEHVLEVWRIEDTATFDRHVSMGTTPAILNPEKPSDETKRSHPTLYKKNMREFKIETCRLDAAKIQFPTVFETQIWSKEKFKSDFEALLKRRNIEIDRVLAKNLEQDHMLRFGLKTYVVESFLDMALDKNPEFLETLKNPLLEQILFSTRRFTQKSVGFEWQSIESDLHVLEQPGRVRRVASDMSQSDSHVFEGLKEEIDGQRRIKFARRNETSLYVESTHHYGWFRDGLIIDLPLQIDASGGQDTVPTRRVFDGESFKAEHDLAEKLSRKARRGYVAIRSKSAKNLIAGLSKLTKDYAKYHKEMVLSARWDAGLFHKKNLVLETEIARILARENDPSALPVLTDFVETIMRVAAKDVSPIPPYPRDLIKGHVHWDVWHHDDGAQVGMPSVNALIALSERVPELALSFYRYRDFEHDTYTGEDGLLKDVLPHVSLEKPGVLKLLAIVSFQLLATGRVQNNLFAQHGMDRVAQALENGTLSPKLAAQIFTDEARGLQGELSWGENLGPHGLVAQAVYGLDKSSKATAAFGEAMLEIYPEAKSYLAEKMAS